VRRPGSIGRGLFGSQWAPLLILILAAWALVDFSDGRHDDARQVVKQGPAARAHRKGNSDFSVVGR